MHGQAFCTISDDRLEVVLERVGDGFCSVGESLSRHLTDHIVQGIQTGVLGHCHRGDLLVEEVNVLCIWIVLVAL